jgi:hypothetical protein
MLYASLFFCAPPARADANNFSFSDFTGDYYLSRDSQQISHLHVVEHLTAVFPQTDQNHGILRSLPKSYENHSVNLQVKSVTNAEGAAQPYSTSTGNGNLVLKIGDAGTYVHGPMTYVITYDADNVTVKPNAGYDGFFWDINGDNWAQPFAHVTARIHLAGDLQPVYQPNYNACFTGARGSTATDCTISPGDAGLITATTTRPLTTDETLTAQIGFAPGTFAGYRVPAVQIWRWVGLLIGLGVLPIGLTLWFTVRRWWRYGRDPRSRNAIVPQYTPAPDLTVLEAGALLNEGFRPKAISATILDLAVRGYLKIYEVQHTGLFKTKVTYEIELIKHPTGLKPEESSTLSLLVGSAALEPGTRIKLSDLANKLYTGAAAIGTSVNRGLTTRGYFRTNPDKIDWPLAIAGGVLTAICFIFASVYIIGFAICALICFIMLKAMPARTALGVEQRDYLLGLKQFISVAEAERIRIMQSPQGNLTEKIDTGDHAKLVKLYERLLPYAMLFGIEKQWAEQFAGLYDREPDWYAGSSGFNAGYFAGSMAGFGAASTTSFTAPSSSSGGGSAGGGGGGGGGGGW